MRILMLTQFYAPVIGGEERIVQDLSTELVRRGHEVAVATQRIPGQERLETQRGVRIHRIPTSSARLPGVFAESERRHVPPAPDPEAVLALRRVVGLERPDVVHAHNWLVDSFLPVKRRSRAPLAMSLHDYSLVCATKRYLYRGAPCDGPALAKCVACAASHYGIAKGVPIALAKRLIGPSERRAVDLFLPVSKAVAERTGLAAARVAHRVIPNFLPAPTAEPPAAVTEQLARLPRDGYVLFVGDLSRDKGVHVLLDAYAGLSDAPPLVLIGRQVEAIPRVPNTLALGSWTHAAVLESWRRCTVAVVPSVWPEPFGLVALEAMAAGRPLVATRAGALPELVRDGETGLLVPPGDPHALRGALERLLADHELRERLGRAGARRALAFSAESVVPQVEEAYRACSEPDRL